jgi:hypothetical protein
MRIAQQSKSTYKLRGKELAIRDEEVPHTDG